MLCTSLNSIALVGYNQKLLTAGKHAKRKQAAFTYLPQRSRDSSKDLQSKYIALFIPYIVTILKALLHTCTIASYLLSS